MSVKKENALQSSEVFGGKPINPHWCKTCMFARGAPPWADTPEKAYCKIFERDTGQQKPPDVYFDGAQCEYYEKG
jgi:hypothetical protein